MSKYGLFGKFTVTEGQRNTMVKILLEAAESMRDLSSCEQYQVSTSIDEPDCVYVYEIWSDEEAHQASLHLPSTQTLIQKAKPIITGMERIKTLESIGGKGISPI